MDFLKKKKGNKMRSLTDYEINMIGEAYSTLEKINWEEAQILYSEEYSKVTKVFAEPDSVLRIWNEKTDSYHDLIEEDSKQWVDLICMNLESINGGEHYDEIRKILMMVAEDGY